MKKLVWIIAAVLLLLTACAPGNSQRGKELGYFTYPGTDWGMTEEEVFNALGKEKTDFRQDELDDSRLTQYSISGTEFLGAKAEEIRFVFMEVEENSESFLYSVTVVYAKEVDPNAVIERLNAFAKEQSVATTEGKTVRNRFEGENMKTVFDDEALYAEGVTSVWVSYSMLSAATVATLPKETIDAAEKGFDALKHPNVKTTLNDLYADKPLSGATANYFCDVNESGEKEDAELLVTLFGTISLIEAYANAA